MAAEKNVEYEQAGRPGTKRKTESPFLRVETHKHGRSKQLAVSTQRRGRGLKKRRG